MPSQIFVCTCACVMGLMKERFFSRRIELHTTVLISKALFPHDHMGPSFFSYQHSFEEQFLTYGFDFTLAVLGCCAHLQ